MAITKLPDPIVPSLDLQPQQMQDPFQYVPSTNTPDPSQFMAGIAPPAQPTSAPAATTAAKPQTTDIGAAALVHRIAIEEGVPPAILDSVWAQESGRSTDLNKKGPTIEKGKYAGHWGRGPWQIMTFHGEIPNDFEWQTRWAAKYIKAHGVEAYFGKGSVPGMPNMPTSKEYYQQVMERAGQYKDTMSMAAGGTQAASSIVDKLTAMRDQSVSSGRKLEEASSLEQGLTNPYSMLGLGFLAVLGGPFGILAMGVHNYGQSLKEGRYMRAGLLGAGGKPMEPTNTERELMAAGFQPGTPAFQNAMLQYMFKPGSSVNVNTGSGDIVYKPPGAIAPIDAKDLSKGWIYPDEKSATGYRIEKPQGATQVTEGEVKSIGALDAADSALTEIEQSIAQGAKLDNIGGYAKDFISSPGFLNTTARSAAEGLDKVFGTSVTPTQLETKTMVAMEQLRAVIGQYVSGADVPVEQVESFKKWMPTAGDSAVQKQEKIIGLRRFINTLRSAGQLRQRPETTPQPAAAAAASPAAGNAEILKRWGL